MEQLVKIVSAEPDGSARVMLVRQSACSGDCHQCSGCGAAQETVFFTARNPIGAVSGDLVRVQTQTGPVLKAAAVLYMLPVVLFIVGYLVGMRWQLGGLVGLLAFALSIGLIVAYDRLVMKKKNTVYTIIGYASRGFGPKE